jgi:hypothetical protein
MSQPTARRHSAMRCLVTGSEEFDRLRRRLRLGGPAVVRSVDGWSRIDRPPRRLWDPLAPTVRSRRQLKGPQGEGDSVRN